MQWGNTLACLLFSAKLVVTSDWILPTGGFSGKAACFYGERRKRLTKKWATCKSENFPIPLRVQYLCLKISPELVSSVSPIEVL